MQLSGPGMFRLIMCFLLITYAAQAQSAGQYDRGLATQEIEQALYMMGLKADLPDKIWDTNSATALTTLRNRAITAGISENAYGHAIMDHDPASSIDAAVVSLSIAIWNFYDRTHVGRRGMALVHDGAERIFVQTRNRAQSAVDPSKSPLDWCFSDRAAGSGPVAVLGVELPFDGAGMIDLRQSPNTALSQLTNAMLVPYLAQNCPDALQVVKGYPRFQVTVFLRDEVLQQGLLRKQCDNLLVDASPLVEVRADPANPGTFIVGAWAAISAVGLEGVPERVVTRALLDEEELFAPRVECARYENGDGTAYLSQFKNRYGF